MKQTVKIGFKIENYYVYGWKPSIAYIQYGHCGFSKNVIYRFIQD